MAPALVATSEETPGSPAPKNAPPLLVVENLATHFLTRAGVVKAVDGVSFRIDRGEVLALVGESGSGKTVTGWSVLGLVDPPGRIVAGSIRLNGEELVGSSEARLRAHRGRDVAMIFQDPMMTLNPVLRIDTQMIDEFCMENERDSHHLLGSDTVFK